MDENTNSLKGENDENIKKTYFNGHFVIIY